MLPGRQRASIEGPRETQHRPAKRWLALALLYLLVFLYVCDSF